MVNGKWQPWLSLCLGLLCFVLDAALGLGPGLPVLHIALVHLLVGGQVGVQDARFVVLVVALQGPICVRANVMD